MVDLFFIFLYTITIVISLCRLMHEDRLNLLFHVFGLYVGGLPLTLHSIGARLNRDAQTTP